MCRLFGFRSVIKSQVHRSLVHAENALEVQSQFHPHGWGVSYYFEGVPHVIKSERSAIEDNLFKKVSGIVSSETVLAHVRNATMGEVNILNTHPFQFGAWTFAHNGNIKDFEQFRSLILARIHPLFQRFILGNTDSEIIFYFLLTKMSENVDIIGTHLKIEDIASSIRKAVDELVSIVGPYCTEDKCGPSETYLTFILTNGKLMIAHQGGKHLYFSTHKKKCLDRDQCPSFSPSCEAPPESDGLVNHLIFASEPLSGDNIWNQLQLGDIVGIDHRMKILKTTA